MMIMALSAAGVEVVSATEPIDETPTGQVLQGILATVHEFRIKSEVPSPHGVVGEKPSDADSGMQCGKGPTV